VRRGVRGPQARVDLDLPPLSELTGPAPADDLGRRAVHDAKPERTLGRGGDQTSASVELAPNRSVASSAGARHAVPHPGQGPDRGRCVLVEAVDRIGEVIRDADLRGRWAARSSSCWPRRPSTSGSGRGLPRLRLTRLCAGMLPERGWNGVQQSRTPGWTRGHTAGDDSGAMRGTPLRRTRPSSRLPRRDTG
jgi:hypothetical protein